MRTDREQLLFSALATLAQEALKALEAAAAAHSERRRNAELAWAKGKIQRFSDGLYLVDEGQRSDRDLPVDVTIFDLTDPDLARLALGRLNALEQAVRQGEKDAQLHRPAGLVRQSIRQLEHWC